MALSCPAVAVELGCKGNPSLAGQCFMVRGSINITGDAGPALWPATARRPLIVRAANGSDHDLPTVVESVLLDDLYASVSGDFEVCPVSAQPPSNDQFICVEKATNIAVVHGAAWKARNP
jgi:hypothetical protein